MSSDTPAAGSAADRSLGRETPFDRRLPLDGLDPAAVLVAMFDRAGQRPRVASRPADIMATEADRRGFGLDVELARRLLAETPGEPVRVDYLNGRLLKLAFYRGQGREFSHVDVGLFERDHGVGAGGEVLERMRRG